MNRFAILAAVAALSSAPAGFASAETLSEVVPLGDLDLSSASGQATMQARIHRAAGRVCGGAPAYSPLDFYRTRNAAFRTCRVEAANRAMAEVAGQTARVYAERASR